MEAPRHVLLVLDDEGDLHSVGEESDGEALGGETPEAAAHAVNAAIRALPPDVQARRKTNPVVDGQLVPKPSRKRSREDAPAAAPTRRSARRSRQE